MSKHSVYATIFANAAVRVEQGRWGKSTNIGAVTAVSAVSAAAYALYTSNTLSKDDQVIAGNATTEDVLAFGWGKGALSCAGNVPDNVTLFIRVWTDGASQRLVAKWLRDTAEGIRRQDPGKVEYPNCWLVIPGGYRYPAVLAPSSLDINSGNKYVFEHPTNGKVITAERVGYFYAVSDNAGGYSTYGSSVSAIDAFKRFCGFAPTDKSQGADVAGAQPAAKNDSQPQYGYEVFIPGRVWAAFVDSITGLPFPPINWAELPTTEPVHHSEGTSPKLLRNIVENGSEVKWTADNRRAQVALAYVKNDRPYYTVEVFDGLATKSSRFGEDDGAPVDAWREARQFYLDAVEKFKTK